MKNDPFTDRNIQSPGSPPLRPEPPRNRPQSQKTPRQTPESPRPRPSQHPKKTQRRPRHRRIRSLQLAKQLPTQEILQHLVNLNTQRHQEEQSGLIRWLRPEYQCR